MDQPLDLCITLVPPPADAAPETIAATELRCNRLGLQHKGDVLKDPLTTKDHENVRWYLEEYAEWPYEQFLERGKKIEASLAEFGKRLYHVVCSVAAQLIRSGVDAVTAMSASVLVVSATRYAEAFYRALASGSSAPLAQERARQALHDNPSRNVHRRRTDDEGTFITLRDWWLPHYYQQRPVLLQPTKPARKRKSKKSSPGVPLPRLSESMPAEPRYSFSGRAHELLQIERHLLHGKLVVLHGFGGIGKTALAREAADWLTRTKLYAGACFVSFEHGGDATTLLSALGDYLGVYDGNYNPNDTKAALAKLAPVLKAKRTLVIADNLESILPRDDAPLEAAARTSLWDVLLDLAKLGAGVLLTSCDTFFGDGRLAPGSRTAHLLLQGLYPDDAYALAAIAEQLGDASGAAGTCTQLGSVAQYAGRPTEAEGWYKRALELDDQVHPGSRLHAIDFNNLAYLLVEEVQVGRAPVARLAEAKGYAERALAIREKLDASSGVWMTLSILANIADLEGRAEVAQDYRRRERESFAAFAGNRYHIDRQHGQLIAAIAAAAKGDEEQRKVEEAMSYLQAQDEGTEEEAV